MLKNELILKVYEAILFDKLFKFNNRLLNCVQIIDDNQQYWKTKNGAVKYRLKEEIKFQLFICCILLCYTVPAVQIISEPYIACTIPDTIHTST